MCKYAFILESIESSDNFFLPLPKWHNICTLFRCICDGILDSWFSTFDALFVFAWKTCDFWLFAISIECIFTIYKSLSTVQCAVHSCLLISNEIVLIHFESLRWILSETPIWIIITRTRISGWENMKTSIRIDLLIWHILTVWCRRLPGWTDETEMALLLRIYWNAHAVCWEHKIIIWKVEKFFLPLWNANGIHFVRFCCIQKSIFHFPYYFNFGKCRCHKMKLSSVFCCCWKK